MTKGGIGYSYSYPLIFISDKLCSGRAQVPDFSAGSELIGRFPVNYGEPGWEEKFVQKGEKRAESTNSTTLRRDKNKNETKGVVVAAD